MLRVTDLCGREVPYEIEEFDLDESIRDILYELSCDQNGPWFIGEFQYDEI